VILHKLYSWKMSLNNTTITQKVWWKMINSSFLLKFWTIKAFVDYPQCVNRHPVGPETSTVTKQTKFYLLHTICRQHGNLTENTNCLYVHCCIFLDIFWLMHLVMQPSSCAKIYWKLNSVCPLKCGQAQFKYSHNQVFFLQIYI
jgi:hypothetical protein